MSCEGHGLLISDFFFQTLFPTPVSIGVCLTIGYVRLYHFQFFQRGECLGIVAIYACADTCALGCTHRTIRIVKLNGSTRHTRQGLTEDGAEEHIGMSGMNFLHRDAHLFHHLNTILEGENNALLSCTD